MRFLMPVLALAVIAFAAPQISGTSSGSGVFIPETDDIFDSYVYDATVCSSIPASFGDYRVVDDFQNSSDVTIGSFIYWGLTTGAVPTSLNLMCFENNAGMPGTEVFQTSYPITTGPSGFLYAGYTVYTTTMVASVPVPANTPHWFGFHRPDANTWYVGIGPIVTGFEAHRTLAAGYAWQPMSSSIQAADLFKVIEGTVSLDRSTWAGIKNLF